MKNWNKSTSYFLLTFIVVILLQLCSFSVIAQDINHWEMVVAADDTWHYFPGTYEPLPDWTDKSFDSSLWQSGPGGIGYGDNDDKTQISKAISVYIRKSFSIVDISAISGAILHVDYDDAFVAYLNGHEIARANVGEVGTRPSYNTYATSSHEAQVPTGGTPESFMIHQDIIFTYLVEGENILAVQAHNVNSSSSDLSSTTFLTVGITNETVNYRQVPSWFKDPLKEISNLPLLLIETSGQSIVDEAKITAWLKVIDNGDGQVNNIFDDPTDYNGYVGIEIRGQTSQMFPKKSFSFETRNEFGEGIDSGLLGLPAHEDWALYAPYSDKTMLRNALTYHMGRKMGRWQPGFKFCEVYLNGSYSGVYLLIERIKRDKNRLDIAKLKPEEISGDDLTGGYIVKVDKLTGLSSSDYFTTHPINRYSDADNYIFSYVYPKSNVITNEQKAYIFGYLEDFENVLNGISFNDPVLGYKKYIDVNSFVDFQIMNELTNNGDGYRISTFFHKKKDSNGGKLFAGPLWDFNLAYGNVDYLPLNQRTDTWLYPRYGPTNYNTMHWWARLMDDPDYNDQFVSRWKELRNGAFHTDSIMDDMNSMILHLGEAIDRNYERWPIIGQYVWPNYYVGKTYEEDVEYLENWINDRLDWIDANVFLSTGVFKAREEESKLLVYPNPLVDQLNIKFIAQEIGEMNIEIVNMHGQTVFNQLYYPYNVGDQSIHYNIQNLIPGIYMLRIKQNAKVIGVQKLLVKKP